MDGGSARGPGRRHQQRRLPDADADHVRELSARAARGARPAHARARGRARGHLYDAAARAAADLPGRVRLPGLRPPRGPPRPRPLHARRRRSAERPGLPVRGMALQALSLWAAVHARELRDRPARPCRRAMGLQDRGGRLEPGRGRARLTSRGRSRPLPALGSGVRGPQPGAARAGRRRRPQRHADPAPAVGRAGAHGRGTSPLPRRRGGARGRHRDQGHGRARAPLPRARAGTRARAPGHGRERVAVPAGAGAGGPDRLRLPRARLPQRGGRAAAARGRPQRARRDRPPGRPQRNARLVATPVRRRLPGRARGRPVAHRARGRLACGSGLVDARPAALDRMAACPGMRSGRCR